MASMVVMVRGFNAFVARLNAAQTYAGVGDLDERQQFDGAASSVASNPSVLARKPLSSAPPS